MGISDATYIVRFYDFIINQITFFSIAAKKIYFRYNDNRYESLTIELVDLDEITNGASHLLVSY